MIMKRLLSILLLFCASAVYAALPTQQTEWMPPTAKITPPMGYNPYFTGGGLNESNMIAAMDYALTNGFANLGYVYFNVDDGWANSNRVAGHLVFDPVKFPNGTLWITHAHTNGLKAGIYTEAGPLARTVGSAQPTSYGSENIDAADFAAWGIDYIKCDGGLDYLRQALAQKFLYTNSAAPILEQGCFAWNALTHRDFNITRPAGLFGDVISYTALFQWLDFYMTRPQVYGPGHWPYLDMIQIPSGFSDGARNTNDLKTQVSMSAMLSGPLIVANFASVGSQFFTNQEIISVDQDPGVFCCTKIYSNNLAEIYAKKLANYPLSKAVALVNRGDNPVTITANWTPGAPYGGVATVRDLWARSPVAYATNTWSTNVASHDCVVLRVDPGIVPPFPYGTNYLSDFAYMPVWTNAWYTNGGGGNFGGNINYNKTWQNNTLNVGGTNYAKGWGFAANAEFSYFIGKQATNFAFTAGIDNEVGSGGGYLLQIYGDGTLLATTATIDFTHYWTTNINVGGVTVLDFKATTTQVGGADVNNHCDIVNPVLVCPYPKFGP